MANTWGELTWSAGAYGLQNDGNVTLSGLSLSSNLNSITVDAETNQGWGSDTWGTETWGISGLTVELTGISLSSNLNSVTLTGDGFTNITGQELTGALTTPEASSTFVAEVTGIGMTMDVNFDPEIVTPTGQELTSALGTATLQANTIVEISARSASTWNGNYSWGFGAWGNEQVDTLVMSMLEGDLDPAPDVSLTGNAAAIALGEETVIIDVDIALTGQAMTITENSVVVDLNTPVDVTGFDLTMQEGDETTTANADVSLTGINLTISEGSLTTLIWNQINTGPAPIWKEVDTAA